MCAVGCLGLFPSMGVGQARQSGAAPETSSPEIVQEYLTRKAIGAAVRRNLDALASVFAEAERSLNSAPSTKGELTFSDALQYLVIMSCEDREIFLAQGEAAARRFQNEELRLRMIQALLDDEYYEMAKLKGQDRFNRFTRVFNRASSSLSKLALFQPQDAFQLLIDAAYSMRQARSTTERERRIVYLARRFLEQYPDAPERPEVEELLRQLSDKLRRARVEQEVLAGQAALEAQDYRAALYHLETATLLDTSHTEARALLDEAKQAQDAWEQACFETVSVTDWERGLSSEEQRVLESATRALLAQRADVLDSLSTSEPRLAGSIRYARVALAEQSGNHEEALSLLRELAANAPDDPGQRAAAALLATPSYNLEQAYDDAVAQLREERKRFVVTGKRTTEDTLYAASSAAVQNVGSSPMNVPALFVTDMLVRSVAEHFRTQLSIDAVVDAGARYIQRYPGSPRAATISQEIAELASKSGDPVRTRAYLAMAGDENPEKLAKVRENEARQLFQSAQQAEDLVERKRLLQKIATDYPETKIARTASRELEKLQPTLKDGAILLTRKMLLEDPELVRALGLPPELVDGNRRNGEIADEGVALLPDASRYSYRLAKDTAFETRDIAKEKRSWIRSRALALHGAFVFKATGKETLQRQVVPLQVEGGAGASGVEVAPKILPYPEPKKDSRLFQ